MRHPARRWSQFALAAALVTGAGAALAPTGSTESCEASSDGVTVCTSGHESLLESEGGGVVAVLAVPAVVALVPVLVPRRSTAVAGAILITAAMVVALPSVGLFLLPTVVLSLLAVTAWSRGDQRQDANAPG